jgi:hypothetical protein
LAIREQGDNIVTLFLPERYTEVFTDKDVTVINELTIQYHLVYKGKSSASNAVILQIEQLSVLFLTDRKIAISERFFDGASSYSNTERSLRSDAGIGSWFTEFHPQNFIGLEFIFRLLKFFFIQDISCHLGGSLRTYLAGF